VASVPTRFLRNWIEAHYADRLHRICEGELGPLDAVSIRVRVCGMPARAAEPSQTRRARRAAPVRAGQPWRCGCRPHGTGQDRGSPLDHKLTFESFVVGRSNALACSAAQRVADAKPGQPLSFNPLYIHSPAGQGKTHLLNAISWRIRENNPDTKVLYLTAERFMYHFIAALKDRDTIAFKDYFQTINVLLIDDFQFLQGKTMQQEFCHTFNSLVDSKRQVIVAADVPPSQLECLEHRMRSRLAGGLVVDIEAPDLELRRNILKARLADAGRHDPAIVIPDEVVEFLANRITGGGRELEGALIRVVASQQLTRTPMTVDLAAAAVRDLSHTPEAVRVRIEDILADHRPPLLGVALRPAVAAPRQVDRPAAPDRHVSGQEADLALAARDRQALWRPRSLHGPACGAQDRGAAEGRREACPRSRAADAHGPPRVALFVTCLVDLFRPTVGFAAVKLLEQAGCTVEVPQSPDLLRPAGLQFRRPAQCRRDRPPGYRDICRLRLRGGAVWLVRRHAQEALSGVV
jgi:chromosomal replication initiator protein